MSSDARIVGYCRMCGKALEESDADATEGTLYCVEHAPQVSAGVPAPLAAGSPYTASLPPPMPRANSEVSPPLAFVLGFIPGVGAVYNGQYAKGLLHVVIFGSIISILSSGAARGFVPLFALMIPTFVFYMAFEAYHTAKKRRDGEQVDEFSGLVRARGVRSRFPMAPVLLIAFGVLFLLDNLDLLSIGRLLRYWPALLIVLGVYLLYERIAESKYEPK
ncbi:MAG: DUF5668 domain-containing protein [Acidobacteriota bacterium]